MTTPDFLDEAAWAARDKAISDSLARSEEHDRRCLEAIEKLAETRRELAAQHLFGKAQS